MESEVYGLLNLGSFDLEKNQKSYLLLLLYTVAITIIAAAVSFSIVYSFFLLFPRNRINCTAVYLML